MKLSAPIYHLKRKARILCRKERIPLHAALDRIAANEGFRSWSLLAARMSEQTVTSDLLARLAPGDLLLVGARPGQGKTLLSLELAVEAMKSGSRSFFFTLEYNQNDVRNRFRAIGVDWSHFDTLFEFYNSDAISSDYIEEKLASAPSGSLVVIDYLQILDQRRENPQLMAQVSALKIFARQRGLILVFISQIDRSYDESAKPWPDIEDVRLPNPLDLTLFNKTCFLNNGAVRFQTAG